RSVLSRAPSKSTTKGKSIEQNTKQDNQNRDDFSARLERMQLEVANECRGARTTAARPNQ
ncbi:hypothetical protein ABTN75_20285, partial [Acinetobacter baumannii]